MKTHRTLQRAAALAVVGAATVLWFGCADRDSGPLTGPELQPAQALPDLGPALAAQARHTPALLRIPGVVGTAVGLSRSGQPTVQIFLAQPDVEVPAALDGVPVAAEVTGPFRAFSDPTKRARPAPMGYSVGHPSITAGTIGARVKDGAGHVYILSNNHVLAASNDAELDDPVWQPGAYDGGSSADSVGYLWSFKVIDFYGGQNTFDAAIARSDVANVDNSTPLDDGYGMPSADIYDDLDHDGYFDSEAALLGLNVLKYGRTTKLTQGQITGINGTVTVCYAGYYVCTKSALYVDQLIIGQAGFSDGGDSGSLIVSANTNHPVGLLFAGSSTQTIANRIDLVLNFFHVAVDGSGSEPPPPPTPVTDLAMTSLSAAAAVTQGDVTNVTATVANVGNQDVTTSFDVTLFDETDNIALGTQNVAALAVNASQSLTFSWNTAGASIGDHTLVAYHDFADDAAANDSASTGVTVKDPNAVSTIHVGDLDGSSARGWRSWSATVEITVHDANHNPLNGVSVTGSWSPGGLASDQCRTGELGGNGTCIFLYPGIGRRTRSVTFTVTGLSKNGSSYDASLNHDPDGDSNGTTITVRR